MLRKKEEDLEFWYSTGGGIDFFKLEGIPFTGILEHHYPDNGLESEEEYLGGRPQGWFRSYFQNGQLEREYQTDDNIRITGTYKSYDEGGNLLVEM